MKSELRMEMTIRNAAFLIIIMFTIVFSQNSAKLVIGATPVPHAEILEKAKDLLIKEHIDLQIKIFTDYVTPNIALQSGDIDANFFQHLPYLIDFNESHKLDLVSAGSIHFEPLGLYSKKIKSVTEFKKGDRIAIPNDLTNEARALLLLHNNHVITLNNPTNIKSTVRDIQGYRVAVKIIEIEAAQLSRSLASVTAAIINGNYALDAGFDPSEDAIVSEDAKSIASETYGNIIAVRKENKSMTEITALISVLKSDEIKRFIRDKFRSAVLPVD